MTRKGKIARLPRNIRDEVNRRMDNGEVGTQLLEWLNGLPEVKSVLDAHFEGRPITDQNLSEWKAGGFRQWRMERAEEERVAQIRDLAKEGGELESVHQGQIERSCRNGDDSTLCRHAPQLGRRGDGGIEGKTANDEKLFAGACPDASVQYQ